MAKIVSLDQKTQCVKFSNFELKNELVFQYFDKLPDAQRDEALTKAIHIGVLAMAEDRLSAFLTKTGDELGVQLEHLKLIYDMKQAIFFKTAVKGMAAEEDILDFLQKYFDRRGIKDSAQLTGTMKGTLPKNKTGDLVCTVEGVDERKIVIEVKFDKSMKLGDIEDKDVFTKKFDTAWSQILEAKVNREGQVGIIVFDKALVDSSITKIVEDVGFVRGVGFIAIVDSQAGDYANLAIAYSLARDIVVNTKDLDVSNVLLEMLVKRIIKDIQSALNIQKNVDTIRKNLDGISDTLAKSFLSLQFTLKYLQKFLADGTLTEADLFSFYSGEEVRQQFATLDLSSLVENGKS